MEFLKQAKKLIQENKKLKNQFKKLEIKEEKLLFDIKKITSSKFFKLWQLYNKIKKIFLNYFFNYLYFLIYIYIKYLFKKKQFKKIKNLYFLILKIKKIPFSFLDKKKQKHIVSIIPVYSIKKYSLKNNYKYKIIYHESKTKIYKPYYLNDKEKKIKEVPRPEIFMAEINNAKIIGSNDFIIAKNKYCLYDQAFKYDSERIDFIYGPIKFFENGYMLIDINKTCKKIIKEGIMMVGLASYNYYHWLIEYLPKFEIIEKCNLNQNVPLLIDEVCKNIPQIKESIEIFNKKKRPIIYLKPNTQYQIKRLFIPSPMNWVIINTKNNQKLMDTDFVISKESLQFIRNKCLSLIKKRKKNGIKRIYIARKNSQLRKFNEADIKKIFLDLGFEIIYPEEISFIKQVELFSQVEIIAGATGAGLTNIIFAPQNTKIICLINQKIKEFTAFSNIAGLLNQKMFFLAGKPIKEKNLPYYQYNFYINPKYVKESVKKILASKFY